MRTAEPSDEQRLDAALSAPRGNIPDPVAFDVSSAPVSSGSAFFSGDELVNEHAVRYGGRHHGRIGVYGYGFGVARTPPARSQALSHPEGVPGGSRPGLLP
ncbi:MAG: hypothetical protein ACJ790_10660 [Myxococcaceae bacterium]